MKKIRKAERATGLQAVVVYWVDSAGADGWIRRDELKGFAPLDCVTVGFLVEKTDDHLTVASSTAGGNGEQFQVNSPTSIPLVSITRWAFL